MRARLTRDEGITRADRGLHNPHESRRTTLPALLAVDEAADLMRPGTGESTEMGRPAIKVVEIYWQRGLRCKNDQ